MSQKIQNHCLRHGCICTHTEPCEYGWIWVEYYEDKVLKSAKGTKVISEKFEGVHPCPTCRPELAEIVRTSKTPHELHEKLQSRATAKRIKAYEESESSKTRTL